MKKFGIWSLVIGICLGFGIWSLGFIVGGCGQSTGVGDTTAPTFSGLITATVPATPEGYSQVNLTWEAATDDTTSQSNIVYKVYEMKAGQTLSEATIHTTSAGVASYEVTNLIANQTYNFIVRAKDEAGNIDTNGVVKTATTEGVGTWTALSTVITKDLYCVDKVPDEVWVSGASGALYYFNGSSWSSVTAPSSLTQEAIYAVFHLSAPPEVYIVGGSSGEVHLSTDYGQIWSFTQSSLETTVLDLAPLTTNVSLGIAGSAKKVYKVTHWTGLTTCEGAGTGWNGVYATTIVGGYRAWVTGDNGTVKTVSGVIDDLVTGSWSNVNLGLTITENLNDVCIEPTTQGWIVGNNGTILFTYNGGTNWVKYRSGTTKKLNGVVGAFTGAYIVGDDGLVLKLQ